MSWFGRNPQQNWVVLFMCVLRALSVECSRFHSDLVCLFFHCSSSTLDSNLKVSQNCWVGKGRWNITFGLWFCNWVSFSHIVKIGLKSFMDVSFSSRVWFCLLVFMDVFSVSSQRLNSFLNISFLAPWWTWYIVVFLDHTLGENSIFICIQCSIWFRPHFCTVLSLIIYLEHSYSSCQASYQKLLENAHICRYWTGRKVLILFVDTSSFLCLFWKYLASFLTKINIAWKNQNLVFFMPL